MKTLNIIPMIMLLMSMTGICALAVNDDLVIKSGEVYVLSLKGVPIEESQAWDKNYKVDKEGNIKLPLGGKVKIAGKSIKEAEKAIEEHLIDEEIYTVPKIKLKKVRP